MSSNRQIQANLSNAQLSTGPITEEGKAASSQNSCRHGLSGAALIMLPHESLENFIEFANGMRAEHKPVTATEDALVAKMASSIWMSTRAVNMQSMLFAESPNPDNKQMSLYLRYQTVHDRAFSKALSDLQSLRKEARQLEIGFVPQTEEQTGKRELHIAKIRSLNARSEALEIATHLRKTRTNASQTVAAASHAATTLPMPDEKSVA